MSEMSVEAYLGYVREARSKKTYRVYKYGVEKFVEYFGKPANEILQLRRQDWISGDLHQKKRFAREIEKFHKSLIKKGLSINSARTCCTGLLQLFRFYEMPITIGIDSDVSKTVVSTKDFVPSAQQYREMFRVADNLRAKLIVSLGKDLGWRISDFVRIRKDMLPSLERETPTAFDLITEKEDVIARSFLSTETVELLKQYLPTLPKDNPYIFPSRNGKQIPREVNSRLNSDLKCA